jgi:8-hydroxy-5-deazaflavin:NADPH oxidoreductase
MRVGVLGRGEVGRRLAVAFAQRGHEVMIGTRDPDTQDLQDWLSGEGSGIKAGSMADTAQFGELIVLAVLGNAAEDAIAQAGPERFAGKVVIDAMNPLDFSQGPPPRLSICGNDSLGEHVQRTIPDAKVVKAFNTIGNPYFADPSFSEGKPTMFIAGNDDGAKAKVGEIIESFGWPPAVDAGGIDASRELEAMCILWVRLGLLRGSWDHGFKLLAG